MSGAVAHESLACAEEHGLDEHILLTDARDKVVLTPAAAAGQPAVVRCVRDAPEGSVVMAQGPSAVRFRDAMALAGRLVHATGGTLGHSGTAGEGEKIEALIREADVGSPKVSGIEVIDAIDAFEPAAQKSGEALNVCYSHWANLRPEQLRQEFLECEKQFLRDVRGGMDWLDQELQNNPSVSLESEFGVMGR